jgi:hypothetical protein
MLRPARLAALVVATMATAAFAAAPASAGTAAISISGCTVNATSSGTPNSPVTIGAASGRCTVNGITGTATSPGATVSFLGDGGAFAREIVVTVRATVIFVPVTCIYTATNVLLPLVRAGPPTWSYHATGVSATRLAGSSSLCDATVTGDADLTITP